MRETTKTTSYAISPAGEYSLTVSEAPQKKAASSGVGYYKWRFKTKLKGTPWQITMNLFPNESRELLLALGGEEKRAGSIEWDNEEVVGKMIKAEIYHVEDRKGALWEKMRNIRRIVLKGTQKDKDSEAKILKEIEDNIEWEE